MPVLPSVTIIFKISYVSKGDNCEENYNECKPNPCENNSTCVDKVDGFECICGLGFVGEYCEVDLAVCDSADGSEEPRCHNGGLCQEGPGLSFYCFCMPGMFNIHRVVMGFLLWVAPQPYVGFLTDSVLAVCIHGIRS